MTVTANGMKMIDDVNPVRGYLSQQDPRLHFGLGKADAGRVGRDSLAGRQGRDVTNVKARQFLKFVHDAKVTAPLVSSESPAGAGVK